MSDTVSGVAFALVSFALLGGAFAMLSTRNIVHAAFWLLEVSVAAACLYFILGADYVALVQLLVYAGAVAVLVIFSIMITLRRREDAIRPVDFSAPAALLAALFAVVVVIASRGIHLLGPKMPAVAPTLVDFGKLLFSPKGWVLPFELASLVLTAALIGAVWWSREEDE